VTPDVGKRAPFELLAFTAAPVAGGLIVVKLEGRFTPANGRFTRQPVLVVESSDDRPRLELAPIRARRDDGRWRGVYAIPAEAMPDARLALGVRGTLLELPAPDEPDDSDRLSVLAREANNLRRALEAAEADAAEARARADAAEQRVAEADARVAEADTRAAEAEVRAAGVEVRATDADTRASHAEARASAAEQAVRAAEAGTEVLRAELAEERERAPTRTAEAPRGPITPAPVHTAPVHTARPTQPRSPTHWIAVGALALFAFLLLGLLAGFLG
jgi:hypothetical protein